MSEKISVLQFGEGNFLRAFVEWMMDAAHKEGILAGKVAIAKAVPFGDLTPFREQNNEYTLILRGILNGELKNDVQKMTIVADTVGSCEEYDRFMEYADLDSLEYIVSNTTEAGIVYDPADKYEACPPVTYPGKLTKFLYRRFKTFEGAKEAGLYMLPCELIAENGKNLRDCCIKTANNWGLEQDFIDWLDDACYFCDTLVDRIVTGYPRDEIAELEAKLGYSDKLLDVGEPFALWVIEDKGGLSKRLPLDKIGLPVKFTDDVKPYRDRKVRILNGCHTSMVLAAYLAGETIVRDCMNDPTIRKFAETCVYDEIIPTLTLDPEDCKNFASSVFERFANPFIDHQLLSIALNSVSKWKARCKDSFKDYIAKNGKLPKALTFSFAALIRFYAGKKTADGFMGMVNGSEYKIADDAAVVDFFAEAASKLDETDAASVRAYVTAAASQTAFWGEDLTAIEGFVDAVTEGMLAIAQKGAREAMADIVK